jgi:pimeloyl-ACP methyl ester carboxylesterase
VNRRSGHQRINGLKLFIHRFHDPQAPPSGLTILLLHGFMDAGATWDLVAAQLSRAGHDVIAPDLRGFGQSDRRLGIVGHSMGGTIAVLLAGARPDLVERLALLEGMGPVATTPETAVDRMRVWLKDMREAPRAPRALTSMQEAVERLSLYHPTVPRDVIESRAQLLTRIDDQGRLIWAYDPLHRTTSPTPFNIDAFKAFLTRIDCPTLVVSGGPGGWHPADEALRIAHLRTMTTFELPTAGHMMHWTSPEPLAARLVAFFGEPPPPRPGAPGPTGPPPSSAGRG